MRMLIRGATNWKEDVSPDEAARFERFTEELRELQKQRARESGAVSRGLHAKTNIGVAGELIVPAGLPDALRVAVFTEPRSWPVYVRFSNGSGLHQPDGALDIRGVALKLVGVPGRKLIPGLEDKRTQDFLLIHTPAMPFRTPDELVSFVRITAQERGLRLLRRLFGALGFGRTLVVLKGLGTLPRVSSLASVPFYTAAPLRFGASAAKLSLVPLEPAAAPSSSKSPEALRQDLVTRLRNGPLSWSLRAQLFVDEQTTPIEDASVRWPENRSPFHEVARLVIPQQDVTSPGGVKLEEHVERMSFNPWHAMEELRPLGATMRARALAYRGSALERQAAPEPEEMERYESEGPAAA